MTVVEPNEPTGGARPDGQHTGPGGGPPRTDGADEGHPGHPGGSPRTHGPDGPHEGHRSVGGGLARAAVLGINDGIVSNSALILGFAATGVDSSIVRLAGIAGGVAGAISMAAGEWISVTSQRDLIERELAVERREHEFNRRHETEELAERFERQGLEPPAAQEAAEAVMANPETAFEVHARQELGVDPYDLPSPVGAAVLGFVCLLFGATLPLVPWFFGEGDAAALASISIGVVAAAIVGAVIGRFAERPMWFTAGRQVLIVLLASAVTFGIGQLVGVDIG